MVGNFRHRLTRSICYNILKNIIQYMRTVNGPAPVQTYVCHALLLAVDGAASFPGNPGGAESA